MKFMGYTKDSEGKLIIVPEEAEIVRKIFNLYLQGLGISRIAKELQAQGIKTVTGNEKWHSGTIHKMLICEKYIGDAMLQKTYTIDFLTKKRVINDGIVKRYYIKNNHEPIISREQYSQVQEELKMRKNKAELGLKYSSKYPLSALITCGDCQSGYTRCTWQNKKGKKTVVWRCKERIKTGAPNCSTASNLKEELVYNVLVESLSSLLTADKSTLSSMELQDIARIKKVFGNKKITPKSIEQIRLSNIVASITALNTKQIEIKFHSGMTLVKDLY